MMNLTLPKVPFSTDSVSKLQKQLWKDGENTMPPNMMDIDLKLYSDSLDMPGPTTDICKQHLTIAAVIERHVDKFRTYGGH